jgi:hypothetical protein
MNPTRRKILATGATATAMAAMPRVFAEQIGQGGQEELREHADVNSRPAVQSARSSKLAKDHENQSCPCHTSPHRERRDRTSSGEVEADKLAGPAHASLSE